METLRSLVKQQVPQAEELISYQIIGFKYIYMLVGVGIKKGYCSFCTMNPSLVNSLQEDLKGITYQGATLHFPVGEPLPEPIIKKILDLRIAENQARGEAKKKR